ncbi:uncharacterized protein CTRU02_213336 [Colletotrichum truncatum]|uniref:Uncharacterized protein n=1 Tax=Colletotrichum truncatum TaxID=5467 RepID=A0ACC3YKH3_COLTU
MLVQVLVTLFTVVLYYHYHRLFIQLWYFYYYRVFNTLIQLYHYNHFINYTLIQLDYDNYYRLFNKNRLYSSYLVQLYYHGYLIAISFRIHHISNYDIIIEY